VVHAGLYHERLMDMSARKYSKTQGAFTSVDELWRGQMDYSPYAYSFHDPINFMDPSGKAGGGNGGGGDGTTDGSLPGKGGIYIWTGSGVSPFQMINGFTEDEARSIRNKLDLDASWRRLGDFMSQYAPLVQQPKPFNKYADPFYKVNQPSSTDISPYPGTPDMFGLVHLGLDLLGFAPGLYGVVADVVNGLLYLVKGEFKESGLTLLAIIPGLDGLKGVKYAGRAASIFSHIESKIIRQMSGRGWTKELVHETVNNPFTTRAALNRATGYPATAFYQKSGAYVVRDNITGEIVQVSNRLNPGWIPDGTIIDPYFP